jgi:hypothetical protein
VPEHDVISRAARPPTPLRSSAPWRISDIDYASIDRSRVVNDPLLFTLVTMASFVETGSDLYAHVLVSYFDEDPEVAGWLAQSWEHEEVQHGAALRSYVEHAWPDFDWQTVYDQFFEEYAKTCTLPDLEPTRGLELAARCVVEMGTATLYSSLHDYVQEPVLKDLAARIYADEVRHYKHFYRYFRRYQKREPHTVTCGTRRKRVRAGRSSVTIRRFSTGSARSRVATRRVSCRSTCCSGRFSFQRRR